jgi:hypothetical protein
LRFEGFEAVAPWRAGLVLGAGFLSAAGLVAAVAGFACAAGFVWAAGLVLGACFLSRRAGCTGPALAVRRGLCFGDAAGLVEGFAAGFTATRTVSSACSSAVSTRASLSPSALTRLVGAGGAGDGTGHADT